jgi:cytochrome P450
MGNIIAGTDTTSVTTTYLTWALARHPEIQAQVIAEVEKLPLDCTDDDVREVPLFGHVINETLRLYGAASGSMPRDVPAGGITVCGDYIPSGTTISTQAYSLGRIADVWDRADSFTPSRWRSPSKAMKDSFMPWGGGSRGESTKQILTFYTH